MSHVSTRLHTCIDYNRAAFYCFPHCFTGRYLLQVSLSNYYPYLIKCFDLEVFCEIKTPMLLYYNSDIKYHTVAVWTLAVSEFILMDASVCREQDEQTTWQQIHRYPQNSYF